jgi:enamine deaminase RidA (YjgF/YER057c/UK114 family)
VSDVRRISSGVSWEDGFGYSRAVVAGPFVFVSGCTSILDGAIRYEGDPTGRPTALEIVERALVQAGAAIADVVQSRIYIARQGCRGCWLSALRYSTRFDRPRRWSWSRA